MKKSILILITQLALFGTSFSQTEEKQKQVFPLSIAIMNENISIPIVSPLKYGFNPAILVGTEYLLKEKGNHNFHLAGNIGYYYHKAWESTVFLDISLGYRYSLKRFSFSPRIGVGYAHIFSPKPIYKFKDGQFRKVTNFGSPAAQGSFSFNVGFKLKKEDHPPEIYLTYMFTAQIPNSDFGGFHQFAGLGYKFHPFKNNKNE